MLNNKTNRRDHKLIVQQSPGNLMETTLKHATIDPNVCIIMGDPDYGDCQLTIVSE